MFRGLETGQKIGKFFFYFTAFSGNGFVQYTKTANVDKNFSFLTTVPQVVTKLSETSILIDLWKHIYCCF